VGQALQCHKQGDGFATIKGTEALEESTRGLEWVMSSSNAELMWQEVGKLVAIVSNGSMYSAPIPARAERCVIPLFHSVHCTGHTRTPERHAQWQGLETRSSERVSETHDSEASAVTGRGGPYVCFL
jgi:hypothetical protein